MPLILAERPNVLADSRDHSHVGRILGTRSIQPRWFEIRKLQAAGRSRIAGKRPKALRREADRRESGSCRRRGSRVGASLAEIDRYQTGVGPACANAKAQRRPVRSTRIVHDRLIVKFELGPKRLAEAGGLAGDATQGLLGLDL
jgi:hypothetical protein